MQALILAEPNDLLALRVAARLSRSRVGAQVRLVSAAELELSPAWRLQADAGVWASRVRLPSGWLTVDEEDVVFNRIQRLRMDHYATARAADRDYAAMEMFALVVSWLSSLPCPVLDPAAPDGLAGRQRSPIGWQVLAARAGLTPMRLVATTSVRRHRPVGWTEMDPRLLLPGLRTEAPIPHLDRPAVLVAPLGNEACSGVVVGGQVLGRLPAELVAPCLRLARLAGTTLLRCDFRRDGDGRWAFTGADPWLVDGDPAIADAMAHTLLCANRAARETS